MILPARFPPKQLNVFGLNAIFHDFEWPEPPCNRARGRESIEIQLFDLSIINGDLSALWGATRRIQSIALPDFP